MSKDNKTKKPKTVTPGPVVQVTMNIPVNLWDMIVKNAVKAPMFADSFQAAQVKRATPVPFGFQQ